MENVVRSAARLVREGAVQMALPFVAKPGVTGFAGEIISFISLAKKTEVSSPLIDRWRYPDLQPSRFLAHKTFAILRYVHAHHATINAAAALLDETSREQLKYLLAFRALGPGHVSLPNAQSLIANIDAASAMKVADTVTNAPPFQMSLYRVPYPDHDIELECWLGNITGTFLAHQYYFGRDGVSIAPRVGDIGIDAGACFGDTALAFAQTVGPEGRVHSLEPIPKQVAIFQKNVERNPHLKERIILHRYALGDTVGAKLKFTDAGAGARASEAGAIEVESITIDALVKQSALPRVDFIKMDIEGAEIPALRGAADTIRRFKPRLAISIYHSVGELFEIPLLIKEVCPEYQLYIDHYTPHHEETIVYATAK